MRQPRFIHWIYAHIMGYFWRKCPICGEYFGGHEINQITGLDTSDSGGLAICEKLSCQREAGRRNWERWNGATT